jgi:peptidyl-prolyl cis-trans isomerase SurA
MYKIFLTLVCVAALNAEMVDGVAIVVKGSAITLYDIKQEMQKDKVNAKQAAGILIRKKLEEQEIKDRGIEVSSAEVFDDIKNLAARNNLSVDEFYEAVRNSNGLTSAEVKNSVREKLLAQKLYNAVSYTKMSEPTEDEIKEYYDLHKDSFVHPSSFSVVIYASKEKAALEEKTKNPMFYSADITSTEKVLPFNKIAPQLGNLLEHTPVNSFTPITPNGQGGFITFYVKEITSSKQAEFDNVKQLVINQLMQQKREQILTDYFERLRHNAEIRTIRMPNQG